MARPSPPRPRSPSARTRRGPTRRSRFNASSSTDATGSIVDYQWDLNGDGTYDTDTGSNPVLSTSFANSGTTNIGLRIVDSNGASASTSNPLTVGNLPPVAKLTATPNPALAEQQVKLDASASTDQGTITDYKWDLNGDGTYETDTGSTPTVTTSFAATGTHTIGLQETDDQGLTTTISKEVTVLEQASASYPEAVQNTPGLIDYYRLDEATGPSILDSKGLSAGSIIGGTFGQPGRDLAEHGGQLQRLGRLGRDPAQPVRHEQGDGRVLAEVEFLRQQRRPGDGVHPQLQRKHRRLPGRPQLGRVRRHLRHRDRHGQQPQQRLLPASQRGRVAPLRDRHRHLRGRPAARSPPTSTAPPSASSRRAPPAARATSPTRPST